MIGLCLIFFLALLAAILGIYFYIEETGKKDIQEVSDMNESDVIIILGAKVYNDDSVSLTLAKRLDKGFELYEAGKAGKIIVSGDHGQKEYDEVNAMRNYLVKKGVPEENIYMDHAGFNTYSSIYRAVHVFEVKNAIIVTQESHLVRALFIARCLGLDAKGCMAESYYYENKIQRVREVLARVKAFYEAAIIKPEPKYLGDKISIYENSGLITEG